MFVGGMNTIVLSVSSSVYELGVRPSKWMS